VVYRAGILLSVTAVITAYFGAQLTRVLDPDLIRVIFGLLQLILVSSMPPALINIIMSQKHGWRPELVSAVTTILTLFNLVCLAILGLITNL